METDGTMTRPSAGYFESGLPYNRIGHGPRRVICLQGLFPDNAPLTGFGRLLLAPFRFLGADRSAFVVTRRPGLPIGSTLEDMADDYARVIRDELGAPIDVVGMSTGGSIALVLAVRHPELVRRLVLYSAACTLGDEGRRFQRRLAPLAREGRWSSVFAELFAFTALPPRGVGRRLARPLVPLVTAVMGMAVRRPADPTDFVVTIEAEDAFDYRSRLGEVRAPTLVIGGAKDPYYSAELFRQTAAGIPAAKLVLYPDAGHGPSSRRVTREILAFLDGPPGAGEPRG